MIDNGIKDFRTLIVYFSYFFKCIRNNTIVDNRYVFFILIPILNYCQRLVNIITQLVKNIYFTRIVYRNSSI